MSTVAWSPSSESAASVPTLSFDCRLSSNETCLETIDWALPLRYDNTSAIVRVARQRPEVVSMGELSHGTA